MKYNWEKLQKEFDKIYLNDKTKNLGWFADKKGISRNVIYQHLKVRTAKEKHKNFVQIQEEKVQENIVKLAEKGAIKETNELLATKQFLVGLIELSKKKLLEKDKTTGNWQIRSELQFKTLGEGVDTISRASKTVMEINEKLGIGGEAKDNEALNKLRERIDELSDFRKKITEVVDNA